MGGSLDTVSSSRPWRRVQMSAGGRQYGDVQTSATINIAGKLHRSFPSHFSFRNQSPFADITDWSCPFCIFRNGGMKYQVVRCFARTMLAACTLVGITASAGFAQQSVSGSASGKTELVPNQPPRQGRLRIPDDLPGADVAPLRLPPITPSNPMEREAAIKKLFPPLPPLGPPLTAQPGPDGQPLSLSALQRMAQDGNPVLRQAQHDIEAARGAAIQAGLYPNPIVGFEADTISEADTAGQQGGYIQQTIKTAGKLKLAQAAASIDVLNAELALRRAK